MKLAGKVCVITGAGSGIGLATSKLFLEEGAIVLAVDRSEPRPGSPYGKLESTSERLHAASCDVSDEDQMKHCLKDTHKQFGRVDILVNNAGYGFKAKVTETGWEDFQRIMDVNVGGVLLGCKYVIPLMKATGGGVIVNTASVGAFVGVRDRAAYCASKGAVAALTRCVALDHQNDNIRVNAVCPGTVDSPYHRAIIEATGAEETAFRAELAARQPGGRLGSPEEIAQAILFLASDDSTFVNGSMLTVDGGLTAA